MREVCRSRWSPYHQTKRYARGGFEALLPKPRADRGQARALPAAVVEALLAAKEGNPRLSVQLVIREARKSSEVPADLPLPPSTVHRLLARQFRRITGGSLQSMVIIERDRIEDQALDGRGVSECQ